MWPELLALVAMSGAAPSPPHPNSFSISELHIRNDRVELQLRCQVLSLGEVIEGLDPELDGHAEPGEVERFADEIAAYVASHYRLVPGALDDASCADASRALSVVGAFVDEAPLALDPMNEVSEWVDVVLSFEGGEGRAMALDRLGVHQSLFQVTSPGHRDSCAVVWNGLEVGQRQFALGAEAHVFVASPEVIARGAPALQRYFIHGARGALQSVDALLLVLLLALAARPGWRSALISVGVLAGAAAAGAQVGARVPVSSTELRFLELTVPLAIAYVGLDDLLHRDGRTRFIEALVFGLALGGREVVQLAPELIREESPTAPLAGVSLGLGLTLLGVALVLLPALSRCRDSGAAAPRRVRLPVDVTAIGVGLWLFLSTALA